MKKFFSFIGILVFVGIIIILFSGVFYTSQKTKIVTKNNEKTSDVSGKTDEEKIGESRVYEEGGVIYYVDKFFKKTPIIKDTKGEKKLDGSYNPLEEIRYRRPILSPNKKFIAWEKIGYEWATVEIYDIQNKEIHETRVGDGVVFEWTADSRIRVAGQGGMGGGVLGVIESRDNKNPWLVEKVGDVNDFLKMSENLKKVK